RRSALFSLAARSSRGGRLPGSANDPRPRRSLVSAPRGQGDRADRVPPRRLGQRADRGPGPRGGRSAGPNAPGGRRFSAHAREREALPLLARGAALRFSLSRAYDWLNTPPGALVTRKDPMVPARQLAFYADPANAQVFGKGAFA